VKKVELTRRDFIKTSAVVALGALPKSGALPTELYPKLKAYFPTSMFSNDLTGTKWG